MAFFRRHRRCSARKKRGAPKTLRFGQGVGDSAAVVAHMQATRKHTLLSSMAMQVSAEDEAESSEDDDDERIASLHLHREVDERSVLLTPLLECIDGVWRPKKNHEKVGRLTMAKEGNAEVLQFMSEHDTMKRKPVDRSTVSHDVLKSFRYLDDALARTRQVRAQRATPADALVRARRRVVPELRVLRRRRRYSRAPAQHNGVGDSTFAGDDVSVAGDAEEARAESGWWSASGGKQRVGRNERNGGRRSRGGEAVGACEASASAKSRAASLKNKTRVEKIECNERRRCRN
jgi:hypothetical protein